MNFDNVDEMVRVNDKECFEMTDGWSVKRIFGGRLLWGCRGWCPEVLAQE